MSNDNLDKRPDDDDGIFIEDKIEFLSQMKIRSKILKVLKKNFRVREMLVISAKENGDDLPNLRENN